MVIKIQWTDEAKITFDNIVNYLEREWSEKEVKKLIAKSNNVLELISNNPKMFKITKKKNIHRGLVVPQVSIIYRVKKTEIELLSFWDNRQNPKKSKF